MLAYGLHQRIAKRKNIMTEPNAVLAEDLNDRGVAVRCSIDQGPLIQWVISDAEPASNKALEIDYHFTLVDQL